MEDNIEINEYVRTNLGHIGKIIKEYTFKNGEVVYPEPQEYVLDNGYVLNEAGMYQMGENIVKHSPNIIDLIEVGDIVHTRDVLNEDYYHMFDEEMVQATRETIEEGIELVDILTHEQYKTNCCKIKED